MHILVVDDQIEARQFFEKIFKDWGHTVYLAENGSEAWSTLLSATVDMVVTDWMMPEMNGLELCRKIRNAEFENYIYLILISGRNTQQDIIKGLEVGVDDYVTKPVNTQEFRARIEIGQRIVNLEKTLRISYAETERNYYQTIQMFTNLMEVVDEQLGGHCKRVAKLCLRLAKIHPDVAQEDLPVLEAAALLHDIGMVGLPKEIVLKKRTEMNGDEKKLYMSHPVQGEIILKEIEFLKPISVLVRSHHEQVNGLGYPDGLKGDEIPLLSRIIHAASMYDSLVKKWKVPLEDIPDRLQQQREYQLEGNLIDYLLEVNLENIRKEEEKDYLKVSLDALEEGMVLTSSVRMKSGALVLPSLTKLTARGIEKLISYHKLDCIGNTVCVYKSQSGLF
ncbi:MAG: response regulator [Desulfobacterales bacterium]|nr:response regulator [Deltaproteobacteria bacterium]NNL43125.1 response regulator [Desulfobacterales bacterium]